MSKSSYLIIKKSLRYSFAIVTGISTLTSLWGYTIRDIDDSLAWWQCLSMMLMMILVFTLLLALVFQWLQHKGYKTTINGKSVEIKIGDIFDEEGWKVIPFNERFDIQVDDIVIAHSSLNGRMIDNVDNIDELKNTILNASLDNSPLRFQEVEGFRIYPLGRIITYQDFLLMAFSHFDDQNRAYIVNGEYEQILIRMWSEIRRVYAMKKITIPLLGAGITDIIGTSEKNYTGLLKCILCTFRNSKFQPDKGITIILTKDAIKNINMNEIREEF